MEWRCEWCGKPHAEDDPPCDNCGHGSFERAVVPAAPEEADPDDSGGGGPLVWVCADCGREHPRNNPPCSRCGGMTLEKRRQTFDEDDPLPGEEGSESVDDLWGDEESADVAADTMTVWVCPECGRTHPRNNPPCSRCGNMTLEQREQRFDDAETVGGGWLDAVDLKVALGFVGALVLAALVVGPAMGVFDLPGTGPPAVEGVPGESESVDGVDLAAVERSFVDQLGERRRADGASDLSWNRELSLVATFQNRWRVKSEYTDATGPSEEEFRQAWRSVDSCDADDMAFGNHRAARLDGRPATDFDSADGLAAALVDSYLAERDSHGWAPSGEAGAHVHVAPDGEVYVALFVC
jgi:rubrerythrin